MEKVPMLAEGYEKLTADLKLLRAERPKIVDAIEEARAHGDLSENAEYHAAKERQGLHWQNRGHLAIAIYDREKGIPETLRLVFEMG